MKPFILGYLHLWKPPYKMIPIQFMAFKTNKPHCGGLNCYKVDHEFQLQGSQSPIVPWFHMFPLDVRSVICHNSAMSACGKAQQWQLALQLFADLGGEATAVSLNTAINACKSSSFLVCCNVVPPSYKFVYKPY